METDDEMYQFFSEIGLNEYEKRAYYTILEGGIVVAREISSTTGIPYAKVYQTLDAIIDKGLIEGDEGRPRKFKAKNPKIAISSMLDGLKKSWIDNHNIRLNNLKKIELRLESLYTVIKRVGDHEEGVWTIKGLNNIILRISTLIHEHTNQITFSSGNLKLVEKILPKLVQFDVKVILRTTLDYPKGKDFEIEKIENDSQVAIILVDDKAMLSISSNNDDPKDCIGILNQLSDFVKAYKIEISLSSELAR